MYIHLGNDVIIKKKYIIGIFDLDNATVSRHTRNYLSKKEKEGKVINISEDLPKSFIIYKEEDKESIVYISQLSSSTLIKRNESNSIISMEY